MWSWVTKSPRRGAAPQHPRCLHSSSHHDRCGLTPPCPPTAQPTAAQAPCGCAPRRVRRIGSPCQSASAEGSCRNGAAASSSRTTTCRSARCDSSCGPIKGGKAGITKARTARIRCWRQAFGSSSLRLRIGRRTPLAATLLTLRRPSRPLLRHAQPRCSSRQPSPLASRPAAARCISLQRYNPAAGGYGTASNSCRTDDGWAEMGPGGRTGGAPAERESVGLWARG